MDIPNRVEKLKIDHKVVMGAEDKKYRDLYLLIYLLRKKEFVTYYYNRETETVSMGHYILTAASAIIDLIDRADKGRGKDRITIYSKTCNIHLLEVAGVSHLCR